MGVEVKKVTVLGAGYMGSAITFPISDNGISVALWGTWLDDEIIHACKNDNPHPKLKKKLNGNVKPYFSYELGKAINNTDLIIIAVSSEGFVSVYKKLVNLLNNENTPIITLTKGLVKYDNKVLRISEFAGLIYKEQFGDDRPLFWGSVGGPVKAVELSNKIPTFTIIGSRNPTVHKIFKFFETKYYRVSHTDDWIGLEISSAFKNIYAIAGGICDGIYADSMPDQYHNFKSVLFMESIEEMAYACELSGGNKKTAYGLAGTGDLYVTVASGRNSLYGKRIGKGENPEAAYDTMLKEDLLAEGYNTLRLAKLFFDRYDVDIAEETPLFYELFRIIFIDKKYNGQLEKIIKNNRL